jgi:hypothetical protein
MEGEGVTIEQKQDQVRFSGLEKEAHGQVGSSTGGKSLLPALVSPIDKLEDD